MLDVKRLRSDPDAIRDAFRRRREPEETFALLDRVLAADSQWRTVTAELERGRAQRNEASQQVATGKREGADMAVVIEQVRALGDEIHALENVERQLQAQVADLLLRIPNSPHASVPDGDSEDDNPVLAEYGERPSFAFAPKAHYELGQTLGMLDFERAARTTGSRFVFYTGVGARLERALMNLMLDIQCAERGYTEVWPPQLVNEQSMIGTGNLPKFEEDVFRLQDPHYYLIPTAEVPVTNMHRDEILSAQDLPLRYAGFSACYRSEAGSAGKDTRGLIRLHQFNKVELVQFVAPEDSYAALDSIVADAQAVLERLQLPHRLIEICTGDLGFKETKKYDLEVWFPAQERYREISSCSNFEDFQARRANIRFRRDAKARPEFVHTLNGSGLALGRTVAAILENYQLPDGGVRVPAALQPYLGGLQVISAVSN
ncbi:MAG: serine--tRNA ligase [Firmicutes bacterium]|nr:serine--tRNA ligase [Bacillota bacterium]